VRGKSPIQRDRWYRELVITVDLLKGCLAEKSSWTPLVHLLFEHTTSMSSVLVEYVWMMRVMMNPGDETDKVCGLWVWQFGFEILTPLIHDLDPSYILYSL